ncbi:hypothetical protein [Alteribacter keqinensis]|uniref:NERD domain-containing protein n=1 Tax=Alteribacter keqinensis TaxID=2483800 RepID=A0A3M7TY45_9BACI|nr:hypothetical protein [Alteribacter keqinensis]RNA70403.1 hypothetical protein EBO34_10915 [Alteribacter keqinensis]
MKTDWQRRRHHLSTYNYEEIVNSSYNVEGEGRSTWKTWIPFLNKKEINGEPQAEEDAFTPLLNKPISSLEALKKAFMEELYAFQLTWASSTISEKSHVKQSLKYDSFLARLTKTLPDTYMIFYRPVMNVRKAQVEMEVMIVTPTEVWLVHALEGDGNAIFKPLNDRFWIKEQKSYEEKLVHPQVSIKRMRSVIQEILAGNDISYPVKTVVIAKDSFIDLPRNDSSLTVIDKRTFPAWYEKLQRNKSPIKYQQLKVTELLLRHCDTTADSRADFQEETDRLS